MIRPHFTYRLPFSIDRRSISNRSRGPMRKRPAKLELVEEPKMETKPPAPKDTRTLLQRTILRRFSGYYNNERLVELAKRLPFWTIGVILLCWDETSPYSLIRIRGPSMLPTMSADGSDIWLRSTWCWQRRLGLHPSLRKGDLVGFAHPDSSSISCKRIIGLEGDRVPRYGQYVPLYMKHDPEMLGITWPDPSEKAHAWLDRTQKWDEGNKLSNPNEEARRTLIVPKGHVWVEADCPALGVDSRHFGPIPVEWLRGKIVARWWPLWKNDKQPPYTVRPHPIPLDDETLKSYNVHRKA